MEGVWVLPFGQFSSPWRGVKQEVILSVFFGKACISPYSPAPPPPGLLLLLPLPPLPPGLVEVHSQCISPQKRLDPVTELLPRWSSAFRIPRSYFILSFSSAISSFPAFICKRHSHSSLSKKMPSYPYSLPSFCMPLREKRCFSIRQSGFESPHWP